MVQNFPGRVIKRGEADGKLVSLVQTQLADRGYGPFTTAKFDETMVSVIRLFQSQNVDTIGRPLVIDGEIGIYTWGSLFPPPPSQPNSAPSSLMLKALEIALTQEGQRESPLGSNRGPMVNAYLESVGIGPAVGEAKDRYWCMAFVYWCFQSAAKHIHSPNPLPKTAGCLTHWTSAGAIPGAKRISAAQAYQDASLLKPGLIFILDLGEGLGHTGIVEKIHGDGVFTTIEGNTNVGGGNDGIGVFPNDRRKLTDSVLVGFVDYTHA